ncbi:hypothetical protein PanWU01x14_130710, partial [Parasponia andersonii]
MAKLPISLFSLHITILLAMSSSRFDLFLLCWLSEYGIIGGQIRPNDHKMKTTKKDSDATVPLFGHLEGCRWFFLTHLITNFYLRPFSHPRSLP